MNNLVETIETDNIESVEFEVFEFEVGDEVEGLMHRC